MLKPDYESFAFRDRFKIAYKWNNILHEISPDWLKAITSKDISQRN